MAYRVDYSREGKKNKTGQGFRRALMTTAFFVWFLYLVNILWPEGKQMLQILLIPGNPENTLHAAEVFAEELESGYSLMDAAENFCITVLRHGHRG